MDPEDAKVGRASSVGRSTSVITVPSSLPAAAKRRRVSKRLLGPRENSRQIRQTMFASILPLALLFCLVLPCDLQAQTTPTISLSVSPTSGQINDVFFLNIIVDGEIDSNTAPELHGGKDFSITYIGPKVSVVISNGSIRQSKEFVYQMTALKEGLLESPSARVVVAGTELIASSQRITVSKASPAAPSKVSGVDISVNQIVSNEAPYRGQQVVVTTEILSGERLYNPQLPDVTIDSVWHEEFGKPEQSRRIVRGKNYDLFTLRKSIFPLRTGSIEIPARELTAQIRARNQGSRRGGAMFGGFDPFSDSVFDEFFGAGSLTQLSLRSNSNTITVQELPEAPNWVNPSTVLVGKTSIELVYSPHAIKVGESKPIEVTVKSFGNLRPMRSPPIELPSTVRLYEERASQSSSSVAGLALNSKVFKISLVPVAPGKVEIGPISIPYFDPETKTYQMAESQTVEFAVFGDKVAELTPHVSNQVASSPEQPTQSQPSQSALPLTTQTTTTQSPPHAPTATPALQYTELSWLERTTEKFGSQVLILVAILLLALAAMVAIWRVGAKKQASEAASSFEISQSSTLAQLRAALIQYLLARYRLPEIPGETTEAIRARVAALEPDLAWRTELDTIFDEIEELTFSGKEISPEIVGSLQRKILSKI